MVFFFFFFFFFLSKGIAFVLCVVGILGKSFTTNQEIHRYNTRNEGDLNIPKHKVISHLCSYRFSWNLHLDQIFGMVFQTILSKLKA